MLQIWKYGREDVTEVIAGQRPEGRKAGPSHVHIWGKSFPRGGNHVCQGSKVESLKACGTNRKDIIVAGVG